MIPVSFVVIIGNPRPGSRTATAATGAARAVAEAAGIPDTPEIIDLSELAPLLLRPEPADAVAEALDRVLSADVILVASPTYKGTYTGLLKVFLDRVAGGALAGKIALPLLLLGAPQHALAVEVHLRPLLVELGATVPTPGLALLESELERLDSVLAEWAAQVVPAVRGALTAGAAR
ncbi:NAD(P)H-dependent oxidoreductase [Spirillospora sp. NPDC047279]|uniref:NADPH-dependent FMN reductase n=1 Tax=Spirillospora sp. NPDC047279 TaxID=3155478 RepID=UPI0033FB9AE6